MVCRVAYDSGKDRLAEIVGALHHLEFPYAQGIDGHDIIDVQDGHTIKQDHRISWKDTTADLIDDYEMKSIFAFSHENTRYVFAHYFFHDGKTCVIVQEVGGVCLSVKR